MNTKRKLAYMVLGSILVVVGLLDSLLTARKNRFGVI